MKAQIIIADLDDDTNQSEESKYRAQLINERFDNLVSNEQLSQERNKLVVERDLSANDSIRPENIEYITYINALEKMTYDSQQEMMEIEMNYGIRDLGDTQPDEQNEQDKKTFDVQAFFGTKDY